ncbi:MAG: hypothetical protein FD138_3329 [Planctomycetota bacterium]|nr:MAG: hypothetical protein FD138_3329 [Planctomycetota bacterium]
MVVVEDRQSVFINRAGCTGDEPGYFQNVLRVILIRPQLYNTIAFWRLIGQIDI